jgi:hypothetical protein
MKIRTPIEIPENSQLALSLYNCFKFKFVSDSGGAMRFKREDVDGSTTLTIYRNPESLDASHVYSLEFVNGYVSTAHAPNVGEAIQKVRGYLAARGKRVSAMVGVL